MQNQKKLVYRYWRKRNIPDVDLMYVSLFYEDIVKKYYRKGSGRIYISELVNHELLHEMKYLNSDFYVSESDRVKNDEYSGNVKFINSFEELSDLNFLFSFHNTFNLMTDPDEVKDYIADVHEKMASGGLFVLETEVFNHDVFQPYNSSWNYESSESDLKIKIMDDDMDFYDCIKKQKVILKNSSGTVSRSSVFYRIYTIYELKTLFESAGAFELISVHNPYYSEYLDKAKFNGNIVAVFRK